MSDFDLIPPAYRKQMALTQSVMLVVRIGVALLLLMALIWAGLQAGIGSLKSELQGLEQRNNELNTEKARFARLEADARSLKSQQQQLATLNAGGDITELLLSLDRALLPQTIQLTELRLRRPDDTRIANAASDGVIGLRGLAVNHTSLSEFVTRLLAQSSFDAITLQRAERNEDAGADAPLAFAIRGSTKAGASR